MQTMNVYLLPGLKTGPVVLERLIRLISPDRLDTPLEADRFTPREIIAHLADWEPIMMARVQQALDNPGSTVQAWDEGEMAIQNRYSETNIDEQLMKYAAHRAETISLLEKLNADQLKRTIVHPERGSMTVDDQASLLLGHDAYHIEQLSAYLAP
jgi:hypothetical protein